MIAPPIVSILRRHGDAVVSLKVAAAIANVTCPTLVNWSKQDGIGYQVHQGAPWRIHAAAALMRSEGNRAALAAYVAGDRTSELVQPFIDQVAAALEETARRKRAAQERAA